MDYSLAALKLLCTHLDSALQTDSPCSFTLGGILFQRVWVQGVLVAESTPPSDSDHRGRGHLLDDGTGIIELGIPDHFLERHWEPGTYVMVVGALAFLEPFIHPVIKVHKIVDLSACPNREAMWYLEVMEAFKLFYQPSFRD